MKIRLFIILGVIQVIVALGAIPAGLSLVITTDGSGLGLPHEILHETPFSDFFIPGMFLLIVVGLFNLVAAITSFFKSKYSGITGLSMGTILILWILIQVYFIGLSSFMQPLFFFIGLTEVLISLIIVKNLKNEL